MFELKGAPVNVTVPIEEASQNKVAALATANAPANRVVLNIEGIHVDRPVGTTYRVYINLPEGQAPEYPSDHFVGNLAFFGHSHAHGGQETDPQGQPGRRRRFDITRQVQALQARGQWQGQEVNVSFFETRLQPPPGAALAPAAAETVIPVQIDRVTITTG